LAKMLKSAHDRAAPNIRKSPIKVVFPNPKSEKSPLITKNTPKNATPIPNADFRVTLSMRKRLAKRAARIGAVDIRRDALEAVVKCNP